jgi:DNA end-binding protein Ku
MAARPIWRGHLRLALVSCPVALYNARHDRASIRFNLINPETGNRIRMITQDSETGKELERRDLVKGYEFRKGKYLLLNDAELDSVTVRSRAPR